MSHATVQSVYASALLELAIENDELNEVVDDCKALQDILAADAGLIAMATDPNVSTDEMISLLNNFDGKVAKTTMNFLLLLVEKDRFVALPEVLLEFSLLYEEQQGIVPVEICLSKEMSSTEQEAIENKLKKSIGEGVRASFVVDKEILGGIQIRYGDYLLDGSIKSQLDKLHKDLCAVKLENSLAV